MQAMSTEDVKDKRTTIPGLILLGIAAVLYLTSYFYELERAINDLHLGLIALVGILLIIAPRRVTDILLDKLKAKR